MGDENNNGASRFVEKYTPEEHDKDFEGFTDLAGGDLVKLSIPGDMLRGTLISKSTVKGAKGPFEVYTFAHDGTGDRVKLNGTVAIMEAMMNVQSGDKVAIIFEGKVKTGGGNFVEKYLVKHQSRAK